MAIFTMTLMEIIKNNVDIFDFNYSFYSEEHKKQFEEKFINHFYYDEIGSETIGRFKHNLRTMLNEIMPYYSHLYKTTLYEYDPILNYDLTEEINRELNNVEELTGNTINNNKSFDTPINFSTNEYINSPSFIQDDTTNNNHNRTGETRETHRRITKGNIGVMASQDLIEKERNIIINIDKLILEELNILFMGVY